MNIDYVREFISLTEYLNFTKTAMHLNLSQPALSKHIAQLEKDLGVTLIERNLSHVSLTPIGRVFLDDARDIVSMIDDTVGKITKLSKEEPSKIVVESYLSYRPMDELLRMAKHNLRRTNPLLEIEVHDIAHNSPLDAIRNKEIDMCFISFASTSNMKGLKAIPLYGETLAIVVHKSHRLSNRSSVSISDIADETIITSSSAPVADHYALIRESIEQAGAAPTYRDMEWSNVDRLCEFDFTTGIFIDCLGTVLHATPYPLLDEYKIIKLDSDIEIVTNAIMSEDSPNPACEILVNSLKSLIEKTDMNSFLYARPQYT